jgi:hypothetical protein
MSQSGILTVQENILPPEVPLQFIGDNFTVAVPAGNSIILYANQGILNSGATVSFENSGSVILFNVTDVLGNTLIGRESGTFNVTGQYNTGLGLFSLSSLLDGIANTGIGVGSLQALTSGSNNSALGYGSGASLITGESNTSIGYFSLPVATNSLENTSLGALSLSVLTTGNYNTAIGYAALENLVTGSANIAIGRNAGSGLTGAETDNILIGSFGSAGINRTTIIGSVAQNACYVFGILGTTTNFPNLVTVDAGSRQLGSVPDVEYGVLISDADGVPSWLANGTTGQVLTATTGAIPSWQAGGGGGSITLTGDSGGPLVSSSFTFTGGTSGLTFTGAATTLTLGGTLALANGGTNASLVASNGGIFYSTGTAGAILAGTATAGQILRSGASSAPSWSTATYPATTAGSGKVLISNGTNFVESTPTFPNASATSGKFIQSDGTNWIASTPTLPTTAGASGKVLYSNATNYVESVPTFPTTASATSRKIIVSDGTNWVASTETYAVPGTSGNVLTSDGTNWTSAAPGAGSLLPWTVVTGTTQAAAVDNGYIVNNAGLVTVTLPATSAVGKVVAVTGINNATGWSIAQNAGNTIFFGSVTTTPGVGGSLSSTATRDSVFLVCVTANAGWNVLYSVGNITYV